MMILILNLSAYAQDLGDSVFLYSRTTVIILLAVFSSAVLLYTKWARAGKKLFIRKIAGVDAVEDAVGRATEMGKPVLFIPGIADVDQALIEGYSTANEWIRSQGFGAGMGLPNVRRVSDEFAIKSAVGMGTMVQAVIYLKSEEKNED